MDCLYCRSKIGIFRRLTDSKFCSPEHRVKMRALSARELRNQRLYYGEDYEDVSTVFVKPIHGLSRRTPGTGTASAAPAFTILLVAALVVGALGLPALRGRGDGPAARPGAFSSLRAKLHSYATVKVTEDFKSGLHSWIPVDTATVESRDWSYSDGFVRPGSLRLLRDSLGMANYHLEFMGEVQQRSLNWVYRAKNAANYYAGSILITQPGPVPRAEFVRYTVIDGVQQSRTSVSLPSTAQTDSLYKVEVSALSNDFSATVNGMIVDTWSDSRLTSGGVGFFSGEGDVATLRYVSISDRDSMIGRVLSYLGFLAPVSPLP
jgi:hypothetical protein